MFATLELPRRWRDARRDCHATPMADARAWLAGKRVGALWPSQADSWSEPGRRSAVEGRVEEAHVTAAAALLVEARERWPVHSTTCEQRRSTATARARRASGRRGRTCLFPPAVGVNGASSTALLLGDRSHALFPPQMRARACDLAWLGHLAARALEALAEERAFDAIIGERAVDPSRGVLRAVE